MKQQSAIKRALQVQRILAEHYEPGRQDRCKLATLRNYITKEMPISTATFFRYLKVQEKKEERKKNDRQLELF